jgi:hypothetical protein
MNSWKEIQISSNALRQRHPTGGPRTASDLRQFVTRAAKLFVNLLPVTTSSFIFFILKDLKEL